MSDKIYFGKANGFNLRKTLLNWTTRTHHRLAPKHAARKARDLLLKPVRMTAKNPKPSGMSQAVVTSNLGDLAVFRCGQGPVWLLSHGWSGSANQFFPLMAYIAEQGFQAVAFDHTAHGNSGGRHAHMPAFILAVDAVLEHLSEQQVELAGVIGHSMGTAALLESQHPALAQLPMLLVAPILQYRSNLYRTVERSGFSLRLFDAVVREVEQQFNLPITSIDPYQRLLARSQATVIVHDQNDRFADFAPSAQAAASQPLVQLLACEGLGHSRILNAPQLLQAWHSLAQQQPALRVPLSPR